MFDKEKLKIVLSILKHQHVPEEVVCGLVWAAEDKEAQEILAAKRPTYGFYERLLCHLNEMGYDGYAAAERFIAIMHLNTEDFQAWVEDRKFVEQLDQPE